MSSISSNARLIMDQLGRLKMEHPDQPVTGIDLLNMSGLTTAEVNLAVTNLLMERMVTVEVSDRQGDFDFSSIAPTEL